MIDFTVQIGPYKIAVTALHDSTRAFCANYLCEGTPHFSVEITTEDIWFELDAHRRDAEAEGKVYTDTYLEILALLRKITDALFEFNTLLFHGSAVAVNGQAYLFIAKSGTGKSTHTGLWRQLLGDRAVMVNDDKPFLEIGKDGVIAHGSPWNGVHKLGNNISADLKAICILERGDVNKIEKIPSKESLFMLLQQSSRPQDNARMAKYIELIETICQNVSFYRLQCNTELEAAKIAFKAMSE